MVKYKWRANSNCFCTVDRKTAIRLAAIGEHIDPNPHRREYTEEEKAENKKRADSEPGYPIGKI